MHGPFQLLIVENKAAMNMMYKYLFNTLLSSWETFMQVRRQQLELDTEQQIGSK